jgi:N-acetylmuramoyl-L-alanine amidase
MARKKIALDAGHGLKTSGKQTPDGIKEWTLNDKVRDKVVEYLKDYDVEIIHTDNNEGNTDESLKSRLNKYMNAGVDAFVSIHHNAYTGSWNSATGVEVYTDKNPTSKDKLLAKLVYERICNYTGLRGRGIKQANYTVIDQDRIPAILVEGGFMDGSSDYKYITSSVGQLNYAKAVAYGLIEFLGLKRKETEVVKTVEAWAKEVIAGKHGTGHENREASLKRNGCTYDYQTIRAKVNELSGVKATKSLDEWAREVIAGKHGKGHIARKASLKKAGCPYDYQKVRARVNQLV